MTTVTAYLCVDGASDALDFYARAFDAEELLGLTSTSFAISLADVEEFDARWQQALDAGAAVEREPADQFDGHRTGTLVDPFGHRWSLNAVIEEVSPEEMQRRMDAMEAA